MSPRGKTRGELHGWGGYEGQVVSGGGGGGGGGGVSRSEKYVAGFNLTFQGLSV